MMGDKDDVALGSNTKILRLLRIPRIYRLMKVVRLLKLVKLTNTGKFGTIFKNLNLSNLTIKVMQIMGVVFYVNHLTACIWYGVARVTEFPSDSWVVLKGAEDNSIRFNYLISFYWSFQTLATVGFGDISAHNMIEMIVAICCIIFGVGFYSFTIGNMI
jgi:hypothetical protein